MPDYSVFLLGWFLVLLSSIIKMRKFLLNRLCIYTYLCVLLLLLLIVDNVFLVTFSGILTVTLPPPPFCICPPPQLELTPFSHFPSQSTCTLPFPSVLPRLLSWL